MVDVEPLLETPFEEAPNRTFRALLPAGVVPLGVVAVLGRSPLTMVMVGLYLLAAPGYVAFRVRTGGTGTEPSDEANWQLETAADDDGAFENRSTDSADDDV